ncbi:hypothetical protein GA0116948_102271 [Chitinophaga costaii]|uniref:Uncharacterized protein n=1 Tax=Chitinophaga costaii TaxID=1335309 RepID=A0A1C4AT05_9BACT|nr:hypothetical protein GA0116948_102271 [Chitinophaga costaii]
MKKNLTVKQQWLKPKPEEELGEAHHFTTRSSDIHSKYMIIENILTSHIDKVLVIPATINLQHK